MKKRTSLFSDYRAPRLPQTSYTEIRAAKEFPLQKGDLLIVRNAQGRVTTRVEITGHPLNMESRSFYDAKVTEYDR